MALGELFDDFNSQLFLPVPTELGRVFITPRLGRTIRKGGLILSVNDTVTNTCPIRFFCVGDDPLNPDGFGFLGSSEPEYYRTTLIYKWGHTNKVPALVYRSNDFCVYHSPNVATLVTLPFLYKEIETLILAI